MADLGNWLQGNYRVPEAEGSTDEDHGGLDGQDGPDS